MSENLRVCRKCLLNQETEEEFRAKLEEYIANLDEDVRVDQETYEKRLTICGKCPHIINGMCRLCGCFVELRAAVKVRKCPDVERRWQAEE
ncbi:MAG: DUF6171 family protein [Lachnospiraceae bacterium]|nr:DUF6171 family protein [Lachnospiraceae bacterium]